MTRVTLLLSIAPWGATAPEHYGSLRLKAFQALKEVCWGWHMLMRPSWTISFWVKSAITALNRQRHSVCWLDGSGRTYDFPKEMIDVEERPPRYNSFEYFHWTHKLEVPRSFRGKPDQGVIVGDCCTIDRWMWTHVMMTSIMSSFRPITGGKPFTISVVQDELSAHVSEKEAMPMDISLWSSLINESDDESEYSEQATTDQDVMQSLDRLVRAFKEEPEKIHDQIKHKDHMIDTPPEAILCQDWVNRRTTNPDVRLPVFGVSRPMSAASADFLPKAIHLFWPRPFATRTLDRLIPGSGAQEVDHAPFCMPHGADKHALIFVARDLREELCRALKEPEVRDLFHRLEKTVGGELPPSTDHSDSDAVSGACFKLKLAVVAGAVAKRFKSI